MVGDIGFRRILLFVFFVFLLFTIKGNAQTSKIECRTISKIRLEGNNKTKDYIIFRELTFRILDTVCMDKIDNQIEKSKDNLLNTSLFNFVTIEKTLIGNEIIEIDIIVEERWYLWPNPVFEFHVRNVSAFLHEKNWDRINYGLYLSHDNFRGRNEQLRLKFRMGYKEYYSVYFHKPNIGKDQKHGIVSDINYYRMRESEVKTENDSIVYFKDENNYVWELRGLAFSYFYRPLHDTYHKISFNLDKYEIADTLASLNPDYLGNGRTTQKLPTLKFQYINDKRDSRIYPLNGYYLDFYLAKDGFKALNLGDYSDFNVKIASSYYKKLSNSFYCSTGWKFKVSTNSNLPFHKKQALGYSDFLHGLEYYVIKGSSFFLSKNYLKYELIPTRVSEIKYMPLEKFKKFHYALYANLFFDFGYVWDKYPEASNNLVNKFLYSTGIGIDYFTYYDVVLRLEYSINQLGEGGFYFHLGAPILQGN